MNAVAAGNKHSCQCQDPDEWRPTGDLDEENQAAGKRAEAIESGADFTVIQELFQYGIEVGEKWDEDDDGRENTCRNEITRVADGSVDFDGAGFVAFRNDRLPGDERQERGRRNPEKGHEGGNPSCENASANSSSPGSVSRLREQGQGKKGKNQRPDVGPTPPNADCRV